MLHDKSTGQVNRVGYNRYMLTPHLRSQFVTKILTSANGDKFRVVFLVALVNGQVKAQMISAEPLAKADQICLPFVAQKTSVTFVYKASSTPVVSPFNTLFFYNSQPTRAPSITA